MGIMPLKSLSDEPTNPLFDNHTQKESKSITHKYRASIKKLSSVALQIKVASG
jgi:hypothetical protein